MKNGIYLVLLLGLHLVASDSLAQDPSYSLGDQNQMYSNPAFTGTADNFRFGISYRN